jgi:hypothetical protein
MGRKLSHNLKVVGSNPTPATKNNAVNPMGWRRFAFWAESTNAPQMHQLEFMQAVAKKEKGRSRGTGLSPSRHLVVE